LRFSMLSKIAKDDQIACYCDGLSILSANIGLLKLYETIDEVAGYVISQNAFQNKKLFWTSVTKNNKLPRIGQKKFEYYSQNSTI